MGMYSAGRGPTVFPFCTFFPRLVVTVLEGAGPPGTPGGHLALGGARELAQLGAARDGTLAQLVLHRGGS